MVSTATAVLPVPRSPIINSRCPRPIGTKASIALIPVCRGTSTDLRSAIPGAGASIQRRASGLISPLPSIGSPRAFTIRPSIFSPTGTSMIRPVRRTTSPCFILVSPPIKTIPTSSGLKFCTMPLTPPGSSTSSPAITPRMPVTVAIPSPTFSITPTSSKSTSTL